MRLGDALQSSQHESSASPTLEQPTECREQHPAHSSPRNELPRLVAARLQSLKQIEQPARGLQLTCCCFQCSLPKPHTTRSALSKLSSSQKDLVERAHCHMETLVLDSHWSKLTSIASLSCDWFSNILKVVPTRIQILLSVPFHL